MAGGGEKGGSEKERGEEEKTEIEIETLAVSVGTRDLESRFPNIVDKNSDTSQDRYEEC